MKLTPRIILSSIVGAAFFCLFYLIFEASILLSSLFMLGGLIGGFLFFNPKKIDPELEELMSLHGITPKMVKGIIKKGRKKLAKMRRITKKAEDKAVRYKMENICHVVEKVFEDFEEDPKDIKGAKQFLNYYLDATLQIMDKYAVLSKNISNKERKKSLKKVEKLMGDIEEAFENQLSRLYDDDFLHLDSEVKVLEKTLEMEGLKKK
ncbi:5-bromo-4-chloroindolyl phosphate hydrolysis family protein [Spirochaetota bacterium]